MKRFFVLTLLVAGSSFGAVVNFDGDLTHYTEEVATPREIQDFIDKDVLPDTGIETLVLVEKIVNMGLQIWKIIEENRPVLGVKTSYANAVPKGITSSEELERFSTLKSKSYRMYGKNPFGATVYDVTYTPIHRYGGTYKGRGQYLDSVSVLPSNVSVLWGYTVNLSVDRVSTANVGTLESPVATLAMEMAFKVSTAVKAAEVHKVFEFRGDSPNVTIIQ